MSSCNRNSRCLHHCILNSIFIIKIKNNKREKKRLFALDGTDGKTDNDTNKCKTSSFLSFAISYEIEAYVSLAISFNQSVSRFKLGTPCTHAAARKNLRARCKGYFFFSLLLLLLFFIKRRLVYVRLPSMARYRSICVCVCVCETNFSFCVVAVQAAQRWVRWIS